MTRRGRGYSWEPAKAGNTLAKTHGTFAADAAEEAKAVVDALFSEDERQRYPLVTLMAAEIWVRRQRALADIAKRGDTVGEGRTFRDHPLQKHVNSMERTLLDLSNRFGLDPKSESDLVRGRADATRLVNDLDGLARRGRQAHMESEERQQLETGDGQ